MGTPDLESQQYQCSRNIVGISAPRQGCSYHTPTIFLGFAILGSPIHSPYNHYPGLQSYVWPPFHIFVHFLRDLWNPGTSFWVSVLSVSGLQLVGLGECTVEPLFRTATAGHARCLAQLAGIPKVNKLFLPKPFAAGFCVIPDRTLRGPTANNIRALAFCLRNNVPGWG